MGDPPPPKKKNVLESLKKKFDLPIKINRKKKKKMEPPKKMLDFLQKKIVDSNKKKIPQFSFSLHGNGDTIRISREIQ